MLRLGKDYFLRTVKALNFREKIFSLSYLIPMMAKLDINEHLAIVGNFGRYQWISMFLNGTLWALFAIQMFISVFTHGEPKFR